MAAYPQHDPFLQPSDVNGAPLAGAKLYFYAVGTTTTFTIYTDTAGATPHANPVVADASGIFAPIYVPRAIYKTLLTDSADVTVQTMQHVYANDSAFVADNDGTLVTGGTSSAYTVTTSQGLATAANGNRLTVRPHTTNVQGATITPDGGAAVNIKTMGFASEFRVGAGAMQVGGIYDLVYSSVAVGYILMNPSPGEFISSSVLIGAAVAMTTATAADITSITLTPGDWDVEGVISFTGGGSTSVNVLIGFITATSATLPTRPNSGAMSRYAGPAVVAYLPDMAISRLRVSITSNTVYYLEAQGTFTVSTLSGFGFIGARRIS